MYRVLLTGFGKFGNIEQNPTEIIVNRFENTCPEILLTRCVLEVDFNTVPATYEAILQVAQPQMIINMGVAESSSVLYLEKMALNAGFDVYGEKKHFTLQANAPDAYCSALPVEQIALHLCAKGIPALRSNYAGHYLCNMLYYLSLQWCATRKNCHALFVHIPFTTQIAAQLCLQQHKAYASLPQNTIEHAINHIIAWVIAQRQTPNLLNV